jgi:hypothetical protein
MMKVPTGAVLTKYLRALALDIETVDDDGDPVTKAAALASLVWKHALGFIEVEITVKEGGPPDKREVKHGPDWRAIELLYNRIEGKIPLAVVEDQARSLTDKVSELGKARANSLAKAARESSEDAPPEEDEDA